MLSQEPLTKEPSDNTTNELILLVCPVNDFIWVPVIGFHIFILPSSEPLTKDPSDNTTKELILLVCLINVFFKKPLIGFHIFIFLSDEPLTLFSSTKDKMLPLCSVNVLSRFQMAVVGISTFVVVEADVVVIAIEEVKVFEWNS